MRGALSPQLGAQGLRLRDWLLNLPAPRLPVIHADWVVIGLATVAQSFIVGFWSYTRFFVLNRASEIPFGFQLGFAIIAGLALDAAVIFSATSGLEPSPWNLNPRKGKVGLGGWASWTPFIAFAFSSLIAVDTFAVNGEQWNGSELLHVGWPTMVFALSKYGAALRAQRKAAEQTEDARVAELRKELILTKVNAEQLVDAARAERALAEQSANAKQHLLDGIVPEFRTLREGWEREREQMLFAHEADRTRWLEMSASIEQQIKESVERVQVGERQRYHDEIQRERLAWLGQLEQLNADWLRAQEELQQATLEIDRLGQAVNGAKAGAIGSQPYATTKTDTLRVFFEEFTEREGREPTNAEIAAALNWNVNTFNTLAGRVRGERKAREERGA
jgi:hypothetical protein